MFNAGVEDEHERLAVDVLVELHDQVAVLADEVRLDFEAEDDAARLAGEVFSGISLIFIIWKYFISRHKTS